MKKFLSSITAAAILSASALSCGSNIGNVSAAVDINYADALQKSLFFYECQQSGELPEWNRVEWRGDCNVTDFIPGGWNDAGDHAKFNLPMAYSASMIAWGLYQYPDGIEKCGEMTNYTNNLKFVLDYLAKCDLGTEAVYQVGIGKEDHTWWGPAELYEYGMADGGNDYWKGRPYLKASEGCSAVFGEMSAALAAGAAALKKVGAITSAEADDYIKHSENLFKLSDASKSDDEYNASDAQGFYQSNHFYDELFYASNWLYIATGDKSYLDKAKSYIPNLGKELGSDELKYSWSQCWDDVMQGGLLLYAQNTGDSTYIARVKKHLDNLINNVERVDGKVVYIQNWGCLRYATTCGFIAAVACDTLDLGSEAEYEKFYKEQIDYCLGDNPLNQSYVVGYGDKYPHNPHHRTAHCSWKNSLESKDDPKENRHILYGALVGGPNQDGSYEDDRGNYINNEVACDYNAGFTALLAKMIDKEGGKTDPSFPQPEARDDEFFVEAVAKESSAGGITLSLKFTNHAAWPARVVDNLSYKYFLDASEIIDAGFKPEDIVVRVDRDQAAMYGDDCKAVISPVTKYKDNIYYIEVAYPNGEAALPISEGRHQCETILALVFPGYGTGWDAKNDYSNGDILGSEDAVKTDKIPVYLNGNLIYGVEPDGTKPDITNPTTKPTNPTTTKPETTTNKTPEKTLVGDINLDGKVDSADLVLLNQYLVNKSEIKTDEGKINADVLKDNAVNVFDSTALRRMLLK